MYRWQGLRQRPPTFRVDYSHPLAQGLVFAGLGGGNCAGSLMYRDSSPYGNHGTLTNMESDDQTWSVELHRFVIGGNGTDEKIDCGTASAANNCPELTVASWVKTTDTAGGIIGRGSWAVGPGFQLGFVSSASTWQVVGPGGGSEYKEMRGAAACRSGFWAHMCGTWKTDGNKIFFYENGVSSGTLIPGGTVTTYLSAENLACLSITYLGYLNGRISDPMIWNRILSESEISSLANPSNVMLSGLILPPRRKLWTLPISSPSSTRKHLLLKHANKRMKLKFYN